VEKIYASLVNEIFGEKMSRIRRYRKISQAELGRKTGLSRASIANLEGGNQNVQLHQVFSIAVALDVPVDELLPDAREVFLPSGAAENTDRVFLEHARRQLINVIGDRNEDT
jgi:transcriptional regulator with XRE-family HTH domain